MIFVFKTSVKTKNQVLLLKQYIDKMPGNGEWDFDLEDCDRILRIDSEENIVLRISGLLTSNKFHCEESE
ncbi:hypothetical protein BH11BAC7_BH11BAC7_04310 [soil metagenome]